MTTTTTTILVTGSNQGLGFETARQLSKLPHVRLFISGRDSNRVQEALAKIKTAEGCQASVEKVIIDVSNDESIKAAVKEVESKLEGKALDVLIVSASLLKAVVKVNLNGVCWIEQLGCRF